MHSLHLCKLQCNAILAGWEYPQATSAAWREKDTDAKQDLSFCCIVHVLTRNKNSLTKAKYCVNDNRHIMKSQGKGELTANIITRT